MNSLLHFLLTDLEVMTLLRSLSLNVNEPYRLVEK